jgi:thiol:disulfide interchange protein
MRVLLALLLALASVQALAQLPSTAPQTFGIAGNQPDFLPVAEAYRLEVEPQDNGDLRLYWQIEPSYYLYQHRFAFTLDDGEPVALEIDLPPALDRTDDYFGEVSVYYNSADVMLRPQRPLQRAALQVTSQGCADAGLCYPPEKLSYDIDFTTGTATPVSQTQPRPQQSAAVSDKDRGGARASSLPIMLLLAFLGGAILNLMPCVFPILSLKVLGFARGSDHDHQLHGWVYAAGVVSSFVAIAALLIVLQQAGQAIGWGFQLQTPGIVIALAYLFVAMGLSLSGLIAFGGGIMNAGSGLADRAGLSGSFFTGVLAVVVASPCTAPFMGTALGFAMTQTPAIALLVFAALGAGMAAPLLLLSYSPLLRRVMPRPGAWMDTLKQLLAFPLYASAIWLFWVAGRQVGVNTMAVALIGALMLALGLWLWQFGNWRRGLALLCVAVAIAAASWRGLDVSSDQRNSVNPDHVAWSEQKLQQLRAQGQPVFVDVTADWCITCIANEQAVLLTDDMKREFERHQVVYMVADWTNYSAEIADYLARYGRNGIPFYAMYPANPASEPLILPQLLTPSIVIEALQQVSAISPENNAALAELGGL